jgi:hypothetical protein
LFEARHSKAYLASLIEFRRIALSDIHEKSMKTDKGGAFMIIGVYEWISSCLPGYLLVSMSGQMHPNFDKLDEALEAIQLLRERRGIDPAAAIEALSARYLELRNEHPSRFVCSDEDYWKDFHS